IRDLIVTGVQTCALPILTPSIRDFASMMIAKARVVPMWAPLAILAVAFLLRVGFVLLHPRPLTSDELDYDELAWSLAKNGSYQRSEERRVGKECRSRGWI